MLDQMTRFLAFDSSIDAKGIVLGHAVKDLKPREGLVGNFLGVFMETSLFPPLLHNLVGQIEAPPIPANWHADVAEWAAVLRSVELSGAEFSILELGCAWGCWMCNAGMAAKRTGRKIKLMGVEALPEFAEISRHHLILNGFVESEFTVLQGVAGADSGIALFPRKEAGETNFGLSPIFDPSEKQLSDTLTAETHEVVDVYSISHILSDTDRLDLLHIDIQGGEVDILQQNISIISKKVAYIFVGTHSREIEGKIFTIMREHGFFLEIERPAILSLVPSHQPTVIFDGVQAWRNQRFSS